MESIKPFVYGGIASCIAEFGTFPIDVCRTRLQVQEGYKNLKYKGFLNCGIQIYRQEGLYALYSGITPALLRQSVYGTLKFGSYYTLKNTILKNIYQNDHEIVENIYVNVACAALAGATSSAIANPTDVVKVRMQVHGKGSQMPLFKHFYEIFVTEGMRGLYRGVVQTSQRAATIAAVELPIYDYCKHKLIDSIGDQPLNHFISSFIASFFAAVASCPIDVIRTRLMNQRRILRSYGTTSLTHNSTVYFTNSLECFTSIMRNEGIRALYKGFWPSFIRMGPWNIIFFICYEKLKTF